MYSEINVELNIQTINCNSSRDFINYAQRSCHPTFSFPLILSITCLVCRGTWFDQVNKNTLWRLERAPADRHYQEYAHIVPLPLFFPKHCGSVHVIVFTMGRHTAMSIASNWLQGVLVAPSSRSCPNAWSSNLHLIYSGEHGEKEKQHTILII